MGREIGLDQTHDSSLSSLSSLSPFICLLYISRASSFPVLVLRVNGGTEREESEGVYIG